MTQQGTRRHLMTEYEFVIGLVCAFVNRNADGIVAPEVDTRNDAAAKAAYDALESSYPDYATGLYITTNIYGESSDWRAILHHFGATLFRPVEDHGVLYFRKDMVELYHQKDIVGTPEMWHEISGAYIEAYYSMPPQWTAWTERIGYPNSPYVIGALDTSVSDFT